jgi:hypothetical protein
LSGRGSALAQGSVQGKHRVLGDLVRICVSGRHEESSIAIVIVQLHDACLGPLAFAAIPFCARVESVVS